MTFGRPEELLCCSSGFFSYSAWIPSSRMKKKNRHNGAKGSVFKVPSHACHARKLSKNGFI